jgi:hypothetical protein
MHALSNHSQAFLYGFFKVSANGHHFAHTFHAASNLFGYTFKFTQVPARDFTPRYSRVPVQKRPVLFVTEFFSSCSPYPKASLAATNASG